MGGDCVDIGGGGRLPWVNTLTISLDFTASPVHSFRLDRKELELQKHTEKTEVEVALSSGPGSSKQGKTIQYTHYTIARYRRHCAGSIYDSLNANIIDPAHKDFEKETEQDTRGVIFIARHYSYLHHYATISTTDYAARCLVTFEHHH